VLAAYPDRDVRVHVVWFNMVRTDARDRWPRDEIVDDRATHYWDEDKAVGRALASREELAGWRPVAWDVWLLYPPGVTWGDDAPLPAARGRTIIGTREELDAAIRDVPATTPAARLPAAPTVATTRPRAPHSDLASTLNSGPTRIPLALTVRGRP